MTNITPLSDLLNWKLLPGSHKFPSPEGGTCINEAAIVAAGFEYRAVSIATDCPPCFSRPIAQYAIGLNDAMPDGLRQELLTPFVIRLAGTADTDEIEHKRVEHLAIETVRRILPLALTGWPALAERCRSVRTLDEAQTAADDATTYIDAKGGTYAAYAVYAAATAYIVAAARYAKGAATVWREAVAVLDEVISLGKQAEPIETALVVARMDKMREAAMS